MTPSPPRGSCAHRPGACRCRQVRPVRIGHQRVRQRVVALRAAVRPAADLRAPGVRRDRRRALPVVVAEVDPAVTDRRIDAGVAEAHRPGDQEGAVEVRRRRGHARRAPRRRRVAVRARGVPAARRVRQVRLVRQTRGWRHRVLDVRVAHDARRRVRRRVAVPREVDPRRVRRRLVVVAVGRRAGPAAGHGPDPVVGRLRQPHRVEGVDIGRQRDAVIPVGAGVGVAVGAQLDLLDAGVSVEVVGQQLADVLVVARQRQLRHVQRVPSRIVLRVAVGAVRPVVVVACPDRAAAVAGIAASLAELPQLEGYRTRGIDELDGVGVAAGAVARPRRRVVVRVFGVGRSRAARAVDLNAAVAVHRPDIVQITADGDLGGAEPGRSGRIGRVAGNAVAHRTLGVRGQERRVVVRVPGAVGVQVARAGRRRIGVAGTAGRRTAAPVRRHAAQVAAGGRPRAGPEGAAARRNHGVAAGIHDRQGPRQVDRPVGVRVHRRRRVAQRAVRRGIVLRVRLRRHAGGGRPVALRAAVRPAAELRVPRVRRIRRAALPVVVAEVDPAGAERAARRRHRNRRRPART